MLCYPALSLRVVYGAHGVTSSELKIVLTFYVWSICTSVLTALSISNPLFWLASFIALQQYSTCISKRLYSRFVAMMSDASFGV